MSCLSCTITYLLARTEMLEVCMRRINNIATFSPNSQEATDAQRENVGSIRKFESAWSAGRACTHKKEAAAADGGESASEGGSDRGSDRGGDGGGGGGNDVDVMDLTPNNLNPSIKASTIPLHESRGNIGISSLPSNPFVETSRPRQGSRGGRPVAGTGPSSRGGGGKTGGKR